MHWLRRRLDNIVGSGDAALTVPAMDGAFRPNLALDQASALPIDRPDNLVIQGTTCLCSSDNQVYAIDLDEPVIRAVPRQKVGACITAMAGAADGGIAVALDSGKIDILSGKHAGWTISRLGTVPLTCVTALHFIGPDQIVVCIGSSVNPFSQWQRDLLESRSSGSVWRIDLPGGDIDCLADNLAFPFGVLPVEGGCELLVSESWQHRVIRLNPTRRSKPSIALDDLPGYPARLCDDGGGGAWLAIFAPRNQLVEFVMREGAYRERMMTTIAPGHWIAPALRSRDSFLEPLQGGGVRQMGMLKPWAPTRSYGLVAALGPDVQPKASLHSRADGHRHGVTSCVLAGERLIIASKGGDEILFHKVDSE